jgi:hypothetical protein
MRLCSQPFRSLTSSLGTPFFGLFRRDQLHLSDAICPCVARLMQPLDRARIACYPFAMSEMTIATPGGCASRKAFGIFHDCVEYPRRPSRCRYGIVSWKHQRNPCDVPFNTPHGFVFLIVGAVASGNQTQLQIRHTPRGNECFIARIGRVRVSSKPACQHLRAPSVAWSRHPQSTCLFFRLWALPERRGSRPYADR